MPRKPKTAPSPATKIIRQRLRKVLQENFNDFLRDGTEEELRFLQEVFVTRYSCHGGDEPDVAIASAFDDEIARRGDYLCIRDEKLKLAVDSFTHSPEQYLRIETPEALEVMKEFLRDWETSGRKLVPRGDGWHLWRGKQQDGAVH